LTRAGGNLDFGLQVRQELVGESHAFFRLCGGQCIPHNFRDVTGKDVGAIVRVNVVNDRVELGQQRQLGFNARCV
jgi:hypothetical protein